MPVVIVAIILLIGVVYGYYTVTGSGIAEHPYRNAYTSSPGAHRPASASGRDARVSMRDWSRGTR